jgi:uncharacterized protein YcbX
MLVEIGQVEAIFRYPVKSMRGEQLQAANIGLHGLDGDRRLGLRRIGNDSGFPWLTATKLPELLLFAPQREDGTDGELPTHVRTPDGKELAVFGDELASDVGRRLGAAVQMMHLRHGIFDDASISVIASDTVDELARLASQTADMRRFRPNIVVRLERPSAFQEEEWLGGELLFGSVEAGPRVSVTLRDTRCSMINLDPDSAAVAAEMQKAVVRVNSNHAGVYGTVTRTGQVSVGQPIFFRAG